MLCVKDLREIAIAVYQIGNRHGHSLIHVHTSVPIRQTVRIGRTDFLMEIQEQ